MAINVAELQTRLQAIMGNDVNKEAAKKIALLLPHLLSTSFDQKIDTVLRISTILASVAAPELVFALTVVRTLISVLLSNSCSSSSVTLIDSIIGALNLHECGNHIDLLHGTFAQVNGMMERLKAETENAATISAKNIANNYNMENIAQVITSASFLTRVGIRSSWDDASRYMVLFKMISLVTSEYLLLEELRITLIRAQQGPNGIREQLGSWKRNLATKLNSIGEVNTSSIFFTAYYLTSDFIHTLEQFRANIGCTSLLQNDENTFPKHVHITPKRWQDTKFMSYGLVPGHDKCQTLCSSETPKCWQIKYIKRGYYTIGLSNEDGEYILRRFYMIPATKKHVEEEEQAHFILIKMADGYTVIMDMSSKKFLYMDGGGSFASVEHSIQVPGEEGQWLLKPCDSVTYRTCKDESCTLN